MELTLCKEHNTQIKSKPELDFPECEALLPRGKGIGDYCWGVGKMRNKEQSSSSSNLNCEKPRKGLD